MSLYVPLPGVADSGRPQPPLTVVSGGQTGVDRAALDAAMALSIPVGGWCPRGRKAEDGPLPGRYPLVETESEGYAARTGRNVRDSDATLIVTRGPLTGGTRRTALIARRLRRPLLVARLGADGGEGRTRAQAVARFVRKHGVRRLNVAGPRESGNPGIYQEARSFLDEVLGLLAG